MSFRGWEEEQRVRVLAIDTALAACSVAVLDTKIDEILGAETVLMERGHAEALMPLVEAVLGGHSGLASIDRIVVSTGPGSFTGIRVGLAAVRGLTLVTKIPVIGITTLVALAAPVLAHGDGRAVGAAIDARHGRVFFQIFAPNGQGLVPARVLLAKDASRMAGEGAIRLVGSGAQLVAAASHAKHEIVSGEQVPDPVWLARLGAAAPLPDRLPRPVYLRPADAKPQTAGRVERI